MKHLTDFRKTLETGVDPPGCYLSLACYRSTAMLFFSVRS